MDIFFIVTNFILGATILGSQGIRIAFNWDILNWRNNTNHSPGILRGIDTYFDYMAHGIWCMCILWWFDLKEYPKLKKWANAMSVLSLIALVAMILFNIIYRIIVKS